VCHLIGLESIGYDYKLLGVTKSLTWVGNITSDEKLNLGG